MERQQDAAGHSSAMRPSNGWWRSSNRLRNPNIIPGTGLVRVYLAAYLGISEDVSITLDASPYGLGAGVGVAGKIVHFAESHLDHHDEEHFQFRRGDSDGQQV